MTGSQPMKAVRHHQQQDHITAEDKRQQQTEIVTYLRPKFTQLTAQLLDALLDQRNSCFSSVSHCLASNELMVRTAPAACQTAGAIRILARYGESRP